MTSDKVGETLLAALKLAAAEPGEQRLFRSGKLSGLFPSRSGVSAEAAAQALREGLFEAVRTEVRGKTAVEWVRLTPKAVDYLHDHESPVRALDELRAALRTVRERVPAWQAEVRGTLEELNNRLAEDSRRLVQTVEALARRVEETLKRLEEMRPALPDGLAATVPWAGAALAYLDRRRSGAAAGPCPLPELFESVAEHRPELSVSVFHDGLRRLHDEKVLQLVPLTSPAEELARPEFALFHRAAVFYHVAR
jgi:hypothetical protein